MTSSSKPFFFISFLHPKTRTTKIPITFLFYITRGEENTLYAALSPACAAFPLGSPPRAGSNSSIATSEKAIFSVAHIHIQALSHTMNERFSPRTASPAIGPRNRFPHPRARPLTRACAASSARCRKVAVQRRPPGKLTTTTSSSRQCADAISLGEKFLEPSGGQPSERASERVTEGMRGGWRWFMVYAVVDGIFMGICR